MRVRGMVAALVTLLLVPAAGCTSGDRDDEPGESPLTYLGDSVVDGEETLAEATAQWRSAVRSWDQVLTVPDETRCWFLADEDDSIAAEGLCGPFRGLGSKEPEWVLLSFVPTAVQGGVRMAPGTLLPYDDGRGHAQRRIVDADGSEGERAVDVPEPTGWPKVLPAGQSAAHPMRQYGRSEVTRSRVRLLGQDYLLRVVASQRIQFSDRSIHVPPRRGTFLDLRFRHYDSDDELAAVAALRQAAREGRLRISIQAGGRTVRGEVRIPEQRGTGLAIKTFGPSAFFSLPVEVGDDLVVEVDDGRRVWTVAPEWSVMRPIRR